MAHVVWDRVTRDEVLRAMAEYDRLGPEGSFLSMVSALLRLMTVSRTNVVTRRKQSWAPPMSSPPASALPPAISRAGKPAPSPCSENWDSPSSTSNDPAS